MLSDITNMQNTIDVVDGVVDANQIYLITNQAHILAMEALITNMFSDITNMQNNIDTIETTVTNILSDITNMQNTIDVIDGIVDQLTLEIGTNQVLLRTNQARMDVPGADSADNSYMRDVIGNKTDTVSGNSIWAHAHTLNDHFHQPSQVWPTGAAGTNVPSDSTAWTATNVGTNVMIPCNTITSNFDIHYLCIEAISANGVYEITLWNITGALTKIGMVRIVKNATQDGTMNIPIQTPIQAANSCIGISQVNSAGAGATVTVSVFYHTY
jgi:hypothetical protein